jgi:hypothetical protein
MRRLCIGLVAFVSLALPQAVLAVVHVPAGQRVGEINVIADDVRVDGAVTGSVTIIDGSLTVGPRGQLDDRAVVIGGHTTILPGGQVHGDIFQLGSRWPLPEGPAAVAVVAALIALRAILVWLVVSLGMLLARGGRVSVIAVEARTYPIRTLSIGALAGLALGAATVLLAISVLGLIAAAALCGLALAGAVVGIAVVLDELGREPSAPRLIAISLFLPLIGEAVASLALVLALGGAIRSLARPTDGRGRAGSVTAQ